MSGVWISNIYDFCAEVVQLIDAQLRALLWQNLENRLCRHDIVGRLYRCPFLGYDTQDVSILQVCDNEYHQYYAQQGK